MNRKIKILLAAAVFLICGFIALSIVVSMRGKGFIEGRLEKIFAAKSEIGSISLNIPLTVNVRGVRIGELFKADSVSFSPSVLSLFAGKVVLSDLALINPVFNLELSKEGRLNLPKKSAGPKAKERKNSIPFYLTALHITNGRLEFSDKKIMPQGYKTVLSGINVDISKQMLPPASLNTKFRIEAGIVTPEGAPLGEIYAGGWLDFGPKNMDATLQIKGLELTYFAPYYGNFISNKKVSSAKLTTLSDFKAENNDLAITTDLKLHNLVYVEQALQGSQGTSIFDLAQKTLDLFLDPDGNLNLQFTLNTKLDKPRISIPELKKAVLNAAMVSLGEQSPSELFRKGKELYQQFKDFGKGIEVSF